MKRLSTLLFLISIMWTALQCPTFVYAQDEVGQWSVRGSVDAIIPKDDDTDTTVGFAGGIAYQVTPYLRGEIESGWFQADEDILGDLNIWPLFANAQLTMPLDGPLTPYVLGGLGVLFTDFDESQTVKDAGASIKADNVFAIKVGAGMDYKFSEAVALNLEGSYIFGEGDAEFKQGSTTISANDIEYDHWRLGGGIRIYF